MDTLLQTHRSGETDRHASGSTPVASNDARGARPFCVALLESRWFYLVAGLAVTCGPIFVPGVGIREWFLILVVGGMLVYMVIFVGGLALYIAGKRTPASRGRRGR